MAEKGITTELTKFFFGHLKKNPVNDRKITKKQF